MDINIFIFIVTSLAIASISFTITMSWIFLDFREWISSFSNFLKKLFHCPYCLAHYFVFPLVIISEKLKLPIVDFGDSIFFIIINNLINISLSGFGMLGLIAIVHYIILLAYEPAKKAEKLRDVEKRKAEKK